MASPAASSYHFFNKFSINAATFVSDNVGMARWQSIYALIHKIFWYVLLNDEAAI